ncbi:type I glyceraldehyde-3-phosphate dehydrogenase [Natronococcus roseus]|uniref:type I glyceraldehyde-3-phosphate dehydrogenase n=1 Tax=Natronococcus roseus TaxID=1052014 RepID=UPI00374D9BCF
MSKTSQKRGGPLRIGLNGFGRIGRNVLRASLSHDDVEVVAINDVIDNDDMEYLLRYDSVHGRLENVTRDEDTLYIGDQKIDLLAKRDPTALPWDDLDIDVAFEATGIFRTYDEAAQHLEAGADKVLISAPPKGKKEVKTIVYGVNHGEYDGEDIVSNASCTTNSVAPVVKVLDEEFGIESGLLTTVHAYTGTQNLVDGPLSKRRRGRAAAENIIPTSTGAAIATTEVLPELEGKLDGMAMRVPVPNGSITDLTVDLEANVTKEELADAIRKAADEELAGVLGYTDDEIVSRDIVDLPFSSYVDLESSMVLEDGLVKVLTWYDNEFGFSNRMLDLAMHVSAEAENLNVEKAPVQ